MEYNRNSLKDNRRKLRNNPTEAERILWKYLRNRQIENIKFRRQFSVDNFILDYFAPVIKLVIEVDGYTHFKDVEVKYDKRRQLKLETNGLEFLRFTNTEVIEATDYVVERIIDKVKDLIIDVTPSNSPFKGEGD